MDRFHQMQVFVCVAEDAGFAAAARRLEMSPPAVTRAVAALEGDIGVKLLKRTTRQVKVTEAGYRYLQDAKRILAEVTAADEAAAGIHAKPQGRLAITAPMLFGRMFVLPAITDYLQQYPDVSVDTVFLDRVVNLLDEGLDVGVRIGELPDSGMRALRVGSVRIVLVASPDYLAQAGLPHTPADLTQHALIVSKSISFTRNWRFSATVGDFDLKVDAKLSVTTNDAAIAAATQGVGIARVLSYQVAAELQTGQLKTLLAEYEPPPLPVHIVHREDRTAPAKVRTFIDLLASRLRSDNTLN
ncbi:LysR family transcriptional regulator [Motiliproteus sediminis]|uniref:LysR family transcriptional regulator n=1 Tax=Motiliproteus sediminis TaxID=1468178 RepID=UPI001AEFA07E|nr:LysR family transcriptional regulator [Motiliproteus sediminis]